MLAGDVTRASLNGPRNDSLFDAGARFHRGFPLPQPSNPLFGGVERAIPARPPKIRRLP